MPQLMEIIPQTTLREFHDKNLPQQACLQAWFKIAAHAEWRSFKQIKRTFSSAEQQGKYVIFKLKCGCDLITYMRYEQQALYIRNIVATKHEQTDWQFQGAVSKRGVP